MVDALACIVAHIDEPTIIQIRGGVGRIVCRSGNMQWETTMPIAVLEKSKVRVERALERYVSGEDNIIIDD